ncbi:GGDEF domain-containing protein [Paraconexibacter sp.]|uniref:GGDEF domain-containing protein n=1 Tax=Paraconexibacter sp. TaxID=2949640 RepID=UPI00356AE475
MTSGPSPQPVARATLEVPPSARTVLDALAVPVILLDARGVVVATNAAAAATGCEPGADVLTGLPPLDRAAGRAAVQAARAHGGAHEIVLAVPRTMDGRAARGILTHIEGTETFAVTLESQSATGPGACDDLTGLRGRRLILEQLTRRLAESRRYGTPLAVALLDLDRFKRINDHLGHAAGDSALRAASRTMVGRVRTTDDIGRIGGDEFLLLLPSAQGADAAVVLREICSRIAAVTVDGRSRRRMRLSASVGVCAADPEEALDGPDVLRRADDALARAKRRRGRVVVA